jgi:hypothetical protein
MKKILIFQLFLLITQGCSNTYVTKKERQEFACCYTGKDTDIESYIDINGIYTTYDKEYNDYPINMIFLKDGIMAWQIFLNKEKYESDTCINLIEEVAVVKDKSKLIIPSTLKGMYWIQGDTIIVRFLDKPSLLYRSSITEHWYKIIDRQTLQFIYLLMDNTNAQWINKHRYSLVRFHCADSIPNTTCWLKEQKWFWCNEEKWKEYMRKLKEENKAKK